MNSAVLTKTFIYIALLLIGYGGKRLGVFHKEDTRFISKVVLNLTMPAAVINGFQGVEVRPVLLWGLVVGITGNLILIFLGQVFSRRETPGNRAAFIYSISAFNVANFAMPFLTGLVTPDGFATLCMFDIFGVVTSYGINIALVDACMGGDGKIHMKPLMKKIFTTPVVVTYLVLIALSLLDLQLPKPFLELTGVAGGANAFLAMLSIGILFELRLPKEGRSIVARVLGLRYAVCIALMVIVYAAVPVPADMKTALCVVLMAPCVSSAPMLTEISGGNGALAAAINSMSIPISITLMALALTFL